MPFDKMSFFLESKNKIELFFSSLSLLVQMKAVVPQAELPKKTRQRGIGLFGPPRDKLSPGAHQALPLLESPNPFCKGGLESKGVNNCK